MKTIIAYAHRVDARLVQEAERLWKMFNRKFGLSILTLQLGTIVCMCILIVTTVLVYGSGFRYPWLFFWVILTLSKLVAAEFYLALQTAKIKVRWGHAAERARAEQANRIKDNCLLLAIFLTFIFCLWIAVSTGYDRLSAFPLVMLMTFQLLCCIKNYWEAVQTKLADVYGDEMDSLES